MKNSSTVFLLFMCEGGPMHSEVLNFARGERKNLKDTCMSDKHPPQENIIADLIKFISFEIMQIEQKLCLKLKDLICTFE